MVAPRQIGIDDLREYFSMPEKEVAVQLGVCLTSLKKICRAAGVHRWPYRKMKSALKKLSREEGARGLVAVARSSSPSEASGASTIGTPSSSPANSPAASLQFAIITQPSDLPTRSSATQRGWVTVSAAERGNSDLWTTGIAHGTQKRPGLTHEVNDEDHTCCHRNTGPEDSGRIGGNGQGQGSEMSDQEIIAMLAWCAHGAGSTGPGCRTELQWGQDAVETREKTEPASGFVEFGGLELVGALGDQSGLSDGPESSSGEVDDVSNAVDHALDDALFGGDFANF